MGPVQMSLGKKFSEDDIMMLLKSKGKAILEARIKETMFAKNKTTTAH